MTSEGFPFGSLCIIDYRPRPEGLSDLQIQTLTVLARQVPDAATESEAGHAGGRDDAEGDSEAVRMGRMVDVSRGAARGDAHRSVLDVDPDPAHPRQVDDQAVIDAAESSTVVTAAADRQRHSAPAGGGDGLDDVVHRGSPHDQPR